MTGPARCAVALAVLLFAAPVSGGDLIRFRAADGSLGLVDHPSKLPPGAVVLELSKPTRSAPSSDAAPPPAARGEARRLEAPASAGASEAGDHDDARSASWCRRGRAAEERVERAEERLASAEESHDRCDEGGGVHYCSRSSLDAAERELENAQEALGDLESDCRGSVCDPGWLRCAP